MNGTVASLAARSLLGGRRSLLLVALPVVLLALAVVARVPSGASDAAGSGTGASSAASLVLSGFALATVVPLLALIAGTGSIGPEIDDGSIVHLLAEPLARSRIIVSTLAVTVTVVLVLGAVPTLVAGLVLVGAQEHLAVGFAVAAALVLVTVPATWSASRRLGNVRIRGDD